MTSETVDGPACAGHVGLYDQIADLGDQSPMTLLTRARHVCDSCPTALDCHAGAVERGEQWGMWGGVVMTPPAEPTLDQRLGLRTGQEIGDLVEAVVSGELIRRHEDRRAALARLYQEVEIVSRRPEFASVEHPQVPMVAARRHHGVSDPLWLATVRARAVAAAGSAGAHDDEFAAAS
ncbi:hypothetical protein CcI49_23035 [Frankia sp. CcI49]|uniref:WhiB family transcriptional regulator n=1 Tax=Frankia sp. CcI49 TaxID=1745382 RepID=UPI000975DEED|nr:WhiB family transcriptional regulator [Frankia sp. CcI49]ONH58333.1 hypothetical protein CcI49_23035 [Frankia sp. CcI49]